MFSKSMKIPRRCSIEARTGGPGVTVIADGAGIDSGGMGPGAAAATASSGRRGSS
jgi:hypothetical protein